MKDVAKFDRLSRWTISHLSGLVNCNIDYSVLLLHNRTEAPASSQQEDTTTVCQEGRLSLVLVLLSVGSRCFGELFVCCQD